ncbi:MAG: ImmA/IrrE family metallo-endopeptidase [Candidatus Omnitrophica bacterium]|nr:ImmA/IrrE family metallo-endopeptidase [Candidatus Omnitrophota bacterium]
MNVGDRLKQIRLARGFSLEDLAAEMGGVVTKQSLSKYEKGKSEPSLRVLNVMASTLGVKSAYFYEIPSFSVKFHGFHAKAALRVREQEKVQNRIKQLLEDRIKLQRFSKEEQISDFPIHAFSSRNLQAIERAALAIREKWRLGLAPVSSVVETLEENRIHVLELEEGDRFDGQSATVEEDNQTVAVAVIARKVEAGERQRLTLLHELGHVVLKPLKGDAKDVKKANEKAAYRFASSFLAPKEELISLVGERRRFFDVEELILLKKRFGLSIQALLYRMMDLGIISGRQHRQWYIFMTKQGWKVKEPEEMKREEPQWLRRTVLKGYAEGWISQSEAERFLGAPVNLGEHLSLRERRAFMKIPMEQRRKILEKQAQELIEHYNEDDDWKETHAADFIDY